MKSLRRCLYTLCLLWGGLPVDAADPLPLFDVHLHYKWDQAEITSPEQALETLDAAGVDKAVVIGRPAEFALRLQRLAPGRIIPIYGPYLHGGDKLGWQFRRELVEEARAGLRSGRYKGIGELHLIGGMAVRWQDSPVFTALLALAREYDVPVMLHTEYSSPLPTLSICKNNPDVRLLLAHAGAVLPPSDVGRILEACPNLAIDLAARDPWRYVNHPIANDAGDLLPDWRALVMKHPDRVMIGSDPVWPVDRGISWDEPDSGWRHLQRFVAFHRRWLSGLPPKVAEKVRWSNAARWFSDQPD